MTRTDLREKLTKAAAEYDHARRRVREERKQLSATKERLRQLIEAQKIVQAVAESVQNVAHRRIASVVTRCLRAVFEDDHEFEIRFERARGKTEARLVLLKGGEEMTDPMNESGLGVVEVAAFALRVVAVVLSQPARRRVIIADEPVRWLNGEENQQRFAELVKQLVREMKFQLIIVTDDSWLKIGKVIEI